MTNTVFEVPTTELIEKLAKEFQANEKLKAPEFTKFVKTGSHRERAPQRKDWYSIREASVLYRFFVNGPNGIQSLRTYYGGRKKRGVKPESFRKASGKIVRTVVQLLEKEGYLKKAKKGREISNKGKSLLEKKAKELKKELEEKKQKKE